MNKTLLKSAIATALGIASFSSQAALTTSAVLEFDAGVKTCVFAGTFPDCEFGIANIASGSYFSLDTNADGIYSSDEKHVISMNDGVHIGVAQDASGSHTGAPDGLESPGIDNPWLFFSNTGMHLTTSGPTVVVDDVNSDGGFTKTLDFSGWGITWAGLGFTNLGGGIQDCGTQTDGICVNVYGTDIGGVFDNGSGLATITCSTVLCSPGSTFVLDYAAEGRQGDPILDPGYRLHLEGYIGASAVPIPAAAWLFGSGLIGLIGVARRKTA